MLKRFDMVNLYHIAHHSIMPVILWVWFTKILSKPFDSSNFRFLHGGEQNLLQVSIEISPKQTSIRLLILIFVNYRRTCNIPRIYQSIRSHCNLLIPCTHNNFSANQEVVVLVESIFASFSGNFKFSSFIFTILRKS